MKLSSIIDKKIIHMRRVLNFHDQTCKCDFCCYITSIGTEDSDTQSDKMIAEKVRWEDKESEHA